MRAFFFIVLALVAYVAIGIGVVSWIMDWQAARPAFAVLVVALMLGGLCFDRKPAGVPE